MTNAEIFTQTLVDSFQSPQFLRLLSLGTEIDYNEALSSSWNDDLIIEEFKRYKFGHDRYFLSQSRFVRCADDAGLEYKIDRCPNNDYPVPIVTAGQYSFTFHHGISPGEITCQNTSLVRKQYSGLNKEVVQPSLYEKPDFNIEKLYEAENIYANIIHGCGGSGLNFEANGFLRIAVPCITRTDGREKFFFVENVNLMDVLEILEAQDAQKTQAQPMVDTAIPQVKNVKREA